MCLISVFSSMSVKVAKELVEPDQRHKFWFKDPKNILKQKVKFKSNPFRNSVNDYVSNTDRQTGRPI
jgi:hypothetical protein